MRRLSLAVLALGALSGCNCGSVDPLALNHQVGTFTVEVTQVSNPDGSPLSVGDGTQGNPYPFPFGDVVMHVKGQALDERGQPFDLNRPVSIRVSPGDLNASTRWLMATHGVVEGDIQASHVFGRTSVWLADGPPIALFSAGVEIPSNIPDAGFLPDGGSVYSNAAGVSQTVWFETPSLVDVQRQPLCDPGQDYTSPIAGCNTDDDCTDQQHGTQYVCFQHVCLGSCDNRLSPLTGDFVTVSSPDAGMIVTAITQDGFYASDLTAQKLQGYPDGGGNRSAPSWQALPGYFNSVFVYTYSAPINLYVGDRLTQLTGSVAEFSGDTQMDFPGWIKIDLTQEQREAGLGDLPTPEPITLGLCGNKNGQQRTAYDLCGYYNSLMGLESLESAPVTIKNVKPTNLFVNCDANGNASLPLFANSSAAGWYCFTDQGDFEECACEVACVTGRTQPAPDGGTIDYAHLPDGSPAICTEESTYTTFGQWEVALPDEVDGNGNVTFASNGTRINVSTRDALSGFNPKDLAAPEHQGITFDITGMLNQVQAGRPRWLIYARDPTDICCHPNVHTDGNGNTIGTCPDGVNQCNHI